jgi:tryptophanyl-tRNA synthetase
MATKMIDPYGSELVEDYAKIIDQFGLEPFALPLFPDPNRLMRRGIVFAGRDLAVISKCIKEKRKFYALSGIMPTNDTIHLGNKMVVEDMVYFQQHGAETFMLIADLESAAARGVSLKDAQKRALEFHIPAYIALGLDIKKTQFYFQSENKKVVHLGFEFAKRITLNEFKAIYGNADPGRIMSAVIQAGDILFPQFDEKMPGIIPVGIDQDPHIRLTRDLVNRTKQQHHFFPPSSLYNKYTPSLDGSMKMSKSKPEANISIPEDIGSVKKKIMKAKTGGRDTVDEHRKLGAKIDEDMVFELLKQHLVDDDKELQEIHDEYKAGRMLSGELKKIACDKMELFMDDFNKKLEKARDQIDKVRFIEF